MVKSGDESGKNPVIFLYFNFSQPAVSHSEQNEDKNKDFYFSTSQQRHFKSTTCPPNSPFPSNFVLHHELILLRNSRRPCTATIKPLAVADKVIGKRLVTILAMKSEFFFENSRVSRIKIPNESLPRNSQTAIILHNT